MASVMAVSNGMEEPQSLRDADHVTTDRRQDAKFAWFLVNCFPFSVAGES